MARALGAGGYGDFNFLLASFAAFLPLLDAGTSSAFFTFLARAPRGPRFFIVYGAWLSVQAIVPAVLIAFVLPDRLVANVWLKQPREAVLLAFASVFLTTQLWGAVSRMGEARRLTVRVQIASVAQAVIHLALVSIAAATGWLTVRRTIVLLTLEFGALCLSMGPRLLKESLPEGPATQSLREIVVEFWRYSRPLVVYSWVGVPYAFADRWMLQAFAGSAQQGYFSLGAQFASVSLLATTSILSVFWKEIADAKERGDSARIHMLHGRVTRSLYFAAAWLSSALIPYTAEILRWTVGPGYEAATVAFALLLLYPVHQSLGQIQGTFLYASEDTRTFASIGIVMMLVSIPSAYFLLAPHTTSVPGLGLGAVGLALKMVALQFVAVNVQGWFIARKNGWTTDFTYQALTLGCLLAFSWSLRSGIGALLRAILGDAPPLGVVILGTTTFLVVSVAVLMKWPTVAGVPRDELERWWTAGRMRLAGGSFRERR